MLPYKCFGEKVGSGGLGRRKPETVDLGSGTSPGEPRRETRKSETVSLEVRKPEAVELEARKLGAVSLGRSEAPGREQ